MRYLDMRLVVYFIFCTAATCVAGDHPPKNEPSNAEDGFAKIELLLKDDFQITTLTTEYLQNPIGVDKEIPRVSWKIQLDCWNAQLYNSTVPSISRRCPPRQVVQKAYQLHVKITPSKNLPVRQNQDAWKDCGWMASNQTHLVPFHCEGVTPLSTSDMDISWRVSVKLSLDGTGKDVVVKSSGAATFRTGMLSPSSWVGHWISGGTLMRKEFIVPANTSFVMEYATLFVSGIGYHHVYLDGVKVGDHQLDPGWTDYEKRVWYSSYDIRNSSIGATAHSHVISVMMGNGWWSCGPLPRTSQPGCRVDDPPQLILQLNVDGQPVLISDDSWSVSDVSPVVYNSLYNGETYDARIEQQIEGWMLPGFELSDDWKTASRADSVASRAKLASQLFEPIRHVSARPPTSIQSKAISADDMVQVVDFGQNQAAVVRLKNIFCPRGKTITMRHAEILMHPPHGPFDNFTIYTKNLRGAEATDRYICKGDLNGESYTPLFTQHGFRFVEVTGLSYKLGIEDLEVLEMHTDVPRTSDIKFDHPLLDKIQSMVIWGLKSNLMSVQTDCNQRDERRGWMGDAALTAEAASLSFGMGPFYTHWLDQMVEAQSPKDGSMPDFVPSVGETRDGSPNWQTAYAMILWVLVFHYGDRDIVFRHHDSMVRYFDYWENNYARNGLAHLHTGYGDWVPPPPHKRSDASLMSAFALLQNLKIGAELFRRSLHPAASAEANRLERLLEQALTEYHTVFYNNTTRVYMSGLQTEQALSLYLKAVPDDLIPLVLSQLVENIQVTNQGHTTSGIIGIKIVMEILSELGRGDVALDLALQTTYPSWGFMAQNEFEPATTVWELWNSHTAGDEMNSRNHHMFGSISSWFFKYLAGITPIEPGFSRVQIRPNLLRFNDFNVSVVTPNGDVRLVYHRKENKSENNASTVFTYQISLPPCSMGVFQVPMAFSDRLLLVTKADEFHPQSIDSLTILVNGGVVWKDWHYIASAKNGVQLAEQVDNHIHFKISSGLFHFEVQISPTETVSQKVETIQSKPAL